jgi:hypothetical protein
MHFLLLMALIVNSNKSVEVRFTDRSPHIDGIIEEVWLSADSAYDFVQFEPYEKTEPTEKTVVYVLQDSDNLYVAFRCYAKQHKPTACLTADEDDIRIGIDPFNSKNTAYYFQVFASGIFQDGWVLDDGRTYDDSWDGIWYHALKLYDDHWDVEIKIPFKSIRYKKGLDEWSIIFGRYIAHNREYSLWKEFLQIEGVLISKYGISENIHPQATGYYFELYPEAYVRYDKYADEDGEFKPSASLNFKWDITSQTTLNATMYPDFAQIESDPFELNLSQYPTYLDERRPFFLEGKDIFRMADFGDDMQFCDPLDIFYSRRIGKSIDGEAVPILGGIKLTNKSEDWNVGVLGAYTGEYTDTVQSIAEPRRWFGILRARRSIFESSDIGMLFSGTMVDRKDYNYALGIDGVYRNGANQCIVQGALADRNEKMGYAFSSGFAGLLGNFFTITSAEVVHDSFDVSDVGFMPWAGRKQFLLMSGPYKNYPTGFLRELYIAPGIIVVQEPGDTNWSKLGIIEINPNFRNNWGIDLSVQAGPYYEADTQYFYREIDFSFWGNLTGQFINGGCNYSYTYNYRRGFLAYQGLNGISYSYSIVPQVSITLPLYLWIEWDTTSTIIALTPLARPRIDVRINANISLGIFSEFVMQTPGTSLEDTDLLSMRTGFLFSWNFLPKSWLYIALNDYREQDDSGQLQSEYCIAAIKAKYLLYF